MGQKSNKKPTVIYYYAYKTNITFILVLAEWV